MSPPASARSPRTAEDLAREAADCIEDNELRGDPLRAFLAAFIADCAATGDLDAMRNGRALTQKRLERTLNDNAFRPSEPPPASHAASDGEDDGA